MGIIFSAIFNGMSKQTANMGSGASIPDGFSDITLRSYLNQPLVFSSAVSGVKKDYMMSASELILLAADNPDWRPVLKANLPTHGGAGPFSYERVIFHDRQLGYASGFHVDVFFNDANPFFTTQSASSPNSGTELFFDLDFDWTFKQYYDLFYNNRPHVTTSALIYATRSYQLPTASGNFVTLKFSWHPLTGANKGGEI